MSAFFLHIMNKTTHIFPIRIYGLFCSCLFNSHIQTVFANSRNRGTGTATIVRTIVIMPQFYDNPVTFTNSFQHIRPQPVIKSTATGSSQCVIFNGYLIFIKILMFKISPSPLTVISIAQSTGTHR